ncbi:hypothetical protein HNQ08_002669 [Deinococcus humi]|uniref:Uncharacterized protein n=1 Tax=Deinococcus humi TaxID=662880 RepID=A0A7W8JVH1_9DEIO|nr:hypothetical protein [Deinococcus humi]
MLPLSHDARQAILERQAHLLELLVDMQPNHKDGDDTNGGMASCTEEIHRPSCMT